MKWTKGIVRVTGRLIDNKTDLKNEDFIFVH